MIHRSTGMFAHVCKMLRFSSSMVRGFLEHTSFFRTPQRNKICRRTIGRVREVFSLPSSPNPTTREMFVQPAACWGAAVTRFPPRIETAHRHHNFFRLIPILIGVATANISSSACRLGKVLRRIQESSSTNKTHCTTLRLRYEKVLVAECR